MQQRRHCPNTEVGLIMKLHGWAPSAFEGSHEGGKWISVTAKICAEIHKLELPQVRQLIRDLTLVNDLIVNTYTGEGETPQRLLATAAEIGVDAGAIKAALKKEARDAAAAKKVVKAGVKPAKGTKPAQAEIPTASDIDDIRAFIQANPARLHELSQAIMYGAAHNLGKLEAAANALGYIYSTDGWIKSPTVGGGDAMQDDGAPAAAGAPAHADGSAAQPAGADEAKRSTIHIQPKPNAARAAAEASGPVILLKKKRALPDAVATPV